MPLDPEYSPDLKYQTDVLPFRSHNYALEYWEPLQGGDRHDVSCAVCRTSTRSTMVMIPAKASCPTSWTKEYFGYIMTEYKGQQNSAIHRRTMFECVDSGMETVTAQQKTNGQVVVVHVEVDCNCGFSCGPGKYSNHQELNCVVCTK